MDPSEPHRPPIPIEAGLADAAEDEGAEPPIAAADLGDQDEIDALCGFLDGLADHDFEPRIESGSYLRGRREGETARRIRPPRRPTSG